MGKRFIITAEDRIQEYSEKPSATADLPGFTSEPELARVAQAWPMQRMIVLWNHLPGVRPVTKFENRSIAIRRIWRTLTTPTGTPNSRPKIRSKAPRRKPAQGARENSKAAAVITLLEQAEGATLDQIMAATGWQAHSVRGFLSNLGRKRGFRVRSRKHDGLRLYSIQS
jgi:hypothetical protein